MCGMIAQPRVMRSQASAGKLAKVSSLFREWHPPAHACSVAPCGVVRQIPVSVSKFIRSNLTQVTNRRSVRCPQRTLGCVKRALGQRTLCFHGYAATVYSRCFEAPECSACGLQHVYACRISYRTANHCCRRRPRRASEPTRESLAA